MMRSSWILVFLGAACVATAATADPCARPANTIVAENCRPGNPHEEWDINGAGDPSIQGFGTEISINVGGTIFFKVKTDAKAYRVDIYRLGYYNGNGARKVDSVTPFISLPQTQPDCVTEKETLLYDCGNWHPSASWTAPGDAVSGVYIARLVRTDGAPPATWRQDNSQVGQDPRFAVPGAKFERPPPMEHAYGTMGIGTLRKPIIEPQASHIYFVVRNDQVHADIVFQTSDPTWQAYNQYGGHSTYGSFVPGEVVDRCFKSSYNRPLLTRKYRSVNMVLGSEYPMIRFLERNGFSMTYISGIDADRFGATLVNHKLFLSTGHDEYWSGPQRENVERARDLGVSLAFFSGNEVFWRIRWEDSDADESGPAPYRTMVCYKETQSLVKIDPQMDEWTGTFRDSRDINPLGAQPENALTGTLFTANAWRNDPLIVPAEFSRLRFWRNTTVARLEEGQRKITMKGILGHEWDSDLDNGFRPAGLIRMSETTVDNIMHIHDHGSIYDTGSNTHHTVMYRAKSGALVLGTGTVQWSWGLDPWHDSETAVPAHLANFLNTRIGEDLEGPDRDLQQATVNVFADMGVQPATLEGGLVRATQSNDRISPWSAVLSVTDTGDDGILVRVEAGDSGGGVVAGVEVTLDNGLSWHPAIREEPSSDCRTWIYRTMSRPEGAVRSRASDDSCNMERVRIEDADKTEL